MTYIVCGDSFCVNGIQTPYVTRYGQQDPWYDEHHFASLLPDTISYGQGSASNLQIARQFFQSVKRYQQIDGIYICLLYTSPSPRDLSTSRMPSSA